MLKATVIAHPNIALVKYWGKRDEALILPHQSSFSLTLAPLEVTTTVHFGASADEVWLNGAPARGDELRRVTSLLDLLRQTEPALGKAKVASRGNFPAAAGLASSAAGFAALAVAARKAAGLADDVREASVLARRGSGSACRSIQGGACVWHRGQLPDGTDSFATQAFPETHWPKLRLLVAVVSRAEKKVKSRDGMRATVDTSPYYPAWVADAEGEVATAIELMRTKDLPALGELAERNAWRMHAAALAARPPLCYLEPGTLALIRGLEDAREEGLEAWFTLDAGPNPVVLTHARQESEVERWLLGHGAGEVLRCRPGGSARVVGEHLF